MSQSFDPALAEAFGLKMIGVLNGAGLALMTSLGHRVGLFDVMAKLPAATVETIAKEAGLSERYVREWLGAMATGGVVEYREDEATYRLPAEHAALLTRSAVPNNLAASMQWVAVLGGAEDAVAQAFRDGKGVPYSEYNRFHEVMAEESLQSVVAVLIDHVVPLVPGLAERLEAGIDVLDVGCGSGRAMMCLAERFPKSRFHGWDFSDEGIAAASAEASRRGLGNVNFAVRDAAQPGVTAAFDFITAFDAIHDQAKPAAVLANIAAGLRPSGVFLMQDISGSSHLHQDLTHPVGTFLYTVSCMHCMSVSLANGGPGLGAMWGREKALAMLGEAGFNSVDVKMLPHDPLNFWYIARESKTNGEAIKADLSR